jgi:hypothetical protein
LWNSDELGDSISELDLSDHSEDILAQIGAAFDY